MNNGIINYSELTPFQTGIISILDEYDYEVSDLSYMTDVKQLIITMSGIVLFVTESEVSITFEISVTHIEAGNLLLILAEKINPTLIRVSDSFIITTDESGKRIAAFGEDAKSIYQQELSQNTYKNQFYRILTSEHTQFFNC